MTLKTVDEKPTITDTVLFDLYTTDVNGAPVNPYEVNVVTIYFIERDYNTTNQQQFDLPIQNITSSFTYKDAVPFKIYGDDNFPAWLSSDTANAFLTQVPLEIGHFQLQWTPELSLAREGDYFICYTWTPVPAGEILSTSFHFYLGSNQRPPTIPSHITPKDKYKILLERYLPEMFKEYLGTGDISPNVIERTNLAIADGFTEVENLINQILDLQDANVVQEAFLPYLANFFGWQLRSNDTVLWRRQTRQAIPLYKRKGTLGGLKEALDECGIKFRKLTYYWQVVSKATWQDGFIVEPGQTVFCLSKTALLPVDADNFHIFYRPTGSNQYVELSLSYVVFNTTTLTNNDCVGTPVSTTCVTWQGPFPLQPGVLRVIYKVRPPVDQQLENYIQTLPLADQRDELIVTLPLKNWNVRLIADDDALFHVICPQFHPFQYPIVWGKVRTEFPYSENIYNMEEYNGSTRDSLDACDMDGSFLDVCSCCRSSKISLDVEIEDLSNDRLQETEEVIKEFIPFHAVLQSVNYVGLQDELILPPVEQLECLVLATIEDNLILSQFDFNRIVEDGKSDALELKRDMLANADTEAVGNDGVGTNLAYTLYSPGVDFSDVGIATQNSLEVLSGPNTGNYTLQQSGESTADVLGINSFPLNGNLFPFRFSNIQFEETSVSAFQDNVVTLSDVNVDFALYPIPDGNLWTVKVLSGPFAGNYPISFYQPDNTLILSNWIGTVMTGLNYQILAGSVLVASSTSGAISIQFRGRVEAAFDGYDIKNGDFLLWNNQQYPIVGVDTSKVYIDGYTGGNLVGTVNIQVFRRLLDNVVGYFNFRGMTLHTTVDYETSLGIQNGQNPPAIVVESNHFKENYLILIGTTYYNMTDINGQDIYLSGPVLSWGLVGTSPINYSIIHFSKTVVTTQDGETFCFIDRRGEGLISINPPQPCVPLTFRMQVLNELNNGRLVEEAVQTQEDLSYTVITKE